MTKESQPQMSSERDPFGLAGLPQPEPPADAWPHIRSVLQRRHMPWRGAAWAASVAAVTLALGVYWQLADLPSSDDPASAVTLPDMAGVTPATQEQPPTPGGMQHDDSLAALARLSQQLERNLQLVRAEVGVMPDQTLAYQVELEDLVAQIDEAINLHPESRELWSQRVNLLLDLNQLYRTELRRDYSTVASL